MENVESIESLARECFDRIRCASKVQFELEDSIDTIKNKNDCDKNNLVYDTKNFPKLEREKNIPKLIEPSSAVTKKIRKRKPRNKKNTKITENASAQVTPSQNLNEENLVHESTHINVSYVGTTRDAVITNSKSKDPLNGTLNDAEQLALRRKHSLMDELLLGIDDENPNTLKQIMQCSTIKDPSLDFLCKLKLNYNLSRIKLLYRLFS